MPSFHLLLLLCLQRKLPPQLSSRVCIYCCRNCHNAGVGNQNTKLSSTAKIRNIGVLAHIDAGKTTTTERMLFYSGKIKCMGEVHHGNTVTDYMQQERARGITITSASVSFPWKDHRFNLVDTPGHIDFTMEVEQTLSVLDGAVVVLDASAGVEAQTQTVWRQADRYNVPRIVYANKMDRQDASVVLCEESIRNKLGAEVLTIQLPVLEGKELSGVVDILSLNKLVWPEDDNGVGGIRYECLPLTETKDGELWERAVRAREDLADQLSGLDDILAEDVIALESLEMVSASALSSALRRVTILQKGVPLLLGSSYKNKGVQPLMDGIVRFLPSPLERTNKIHQNAFRNSMCAQAFKTVHHPHFGPLVFFRLYSGNIEKGQKLFNIRLGQPENCTKLLVATADDFEEVNSVENGNIAVVAGLRSTRTGDIVTVNSSAASTAFKNLSESMDLSLKDAENLLGVGAKVPDPVFFCSVEAPSPSLQVALDRALAELQREDPSLTVTYNEDTSQTVLGGMGELHLEIIKERLISDYKIDILMGELQIAYRELLIDHVQEELTTDHAIGNSKQYVKLRLTVSPGRKDDNKILRFKSDDKEVEAKLRTLHSTVVKAVMTGVKAGLMFGPKIRCPLMDAEVVVHEVKFARGTSVTIISAAVTRCVRKALEKANTAIMEPIMQLEIVTTEDKLSSVLADLSRRRGLVQNIDLRPTYRVVHCSVPLRELLGYATALRTLTSGTASFTMEFLEYAAVTPNEEIDIMNKEVGFSSC